MWSLEPLLNVTKVAAIRRSTEYFFQMEKYRKFKDIRSIPFWEESTSLGHISAQIW